jgi:hypothetical protein
MRDSEIEQWVLKEIRLTTQRCLKELCVFSSNGVVSLKGTVRSRTVKLAVQEAAERAKGVIAVINELNLRPRTLARSRARVKPQVVPATSPFHLINQQSASNRPAAS